ncbi:MAG TPA: hypothetical protein VED41_03535 [Solirubrobacteraceae bacterium]|nr:hypothetical protein [Solirubrobacteraceae bacterium]
MDEFCGAPMHDAPRPRSDVLADGRADQRMKEFKRSDRREDLRRRESVRGQLSGHRIQPGESRREDHLGAGAEHRERSSERDRLATQPPQPHERRRSHRGRGDPLECRNAPAASGQPRLAGSGQQLFYEQRVTARQLITRRGKRLIGLLVQPQTYELRDRCRAQWPKHQSLNAAATDKLRDLAALGTWIT